MTTTIYDTAGETYRRHHYFIDDKPEAVDPIGLRPCVRGTICTCIPRAKSTSFAVAMSERGILSAFEMNLRPLHTGEKMWVILRPRYSRPGNGETLSSHDMGSALNKLLLYLGSSLYPIVWKEDKHGYCIDHSGRIKRTWELDPF